MGQNKLITREQSLVLECFSNDPFLRKNFYFTGGTALSLYYLKHRFSVDLDFFSEQAFDGQLIIERVSAWAKNLKFMPELRNVEDLYTFWFHFENGSKLKVDFSRYPYGLIDKPMEKDGILIDSKLDIGSNKIAAIVQRSEVKDFVDLYFLLKEYTTWDLIYGVEKKFHMEIDPLVLGNDFLMVNDFEVMPRMIKPLTLKDLKTFFTAKAKETAGRVVE